MENKIYLHKQNTGFLRNKLFVNKVSTIVLSTRYGCKILYNQIFKQISDQNIKSEKFKSIHGKEYVKMSDSEWMKYNDSVGIFTDLEPFEIHILKRREKLLHIKKAEYEEFRRQHKDIFNKFKELENEIHRYSYHVQEDITLEEMITYLSIYIKVPTDIIIMILSYLRS